MAARSADKRCAVAAVAKPIIVLCPNLRCRTVLSVPADVRGRKVRCSRCGTSFLVPTSPPKADNPPAPSAGNKP